MAHGSQERQSIETTTNKADIPSARRTMPCRTHIGVRYGGLTTQAKTELARLKDGIKRRYFACWPHVTQAGRIEGISACRE